MGLTGITSMNTAEGPPTETGKSQKQLYNPRQVSVPQPAPANYLCIMVTGWGCIWSPIFWASQLGTRSCWVFKSCHPEGQTPEQQLNRLAFSPAMNEDSNFDLQSSVSPLALFANWSHSGGCEITWRVRVAFIFISLAMPDIFSSLVASCISSEEKYLL